MPTDVVCPTCNTVSHLADIERDASSFCRTCDFPLFWAQQTRFAGTTADPSGGAGLRRLPGTEGWAIVDQLTCPVCAEPNLVTENFCVRCGADLHPRAEAPTVVEVAPPVIPAAPAPPRKNRWVPVLVIGAFLAECLVVWLVGAYLVY